MKAMKPLAPALPPEGDVEPAALVEFMQAMQDYKHKSGRMFPTWSEVLEVLRDLGYAKPPGVGGAQTRARAS